VKPDLDDAAYSIGRAALGITRRAIVELAAFRRSYDNPATMDLLDIARDALRIALDDNRGDAAALAEARQRITEMRGRLDAYGGE